MGLEEESGKTKLVNLSNVRNLVHHSSSSSLTTFVRPMIVIHSPSQSLCCIWLNNFLLVLSFRIID